MIKFIAIIALLASFTGCASTPADAPKLTRMNEIEISTNQSRFRARDGVKMNKGSQVVTITVNERSAGQK